MLAQFAQLYPHGLIRYTQSTFLELVTDTEVHRIDFEGKISCRLRRGTRGPISFPASHPLLDGLYVPLTTLMARATTHYLPNATALLAAIEVELTRHPITWYDFRRCGWTNNPRHLAAWNILPNLTRTGGIILDGVPSSVAHAVAGICTNYGVETYSLNRHTPTATDALFDLLLVGDNFVVAREFTVSTLC